MGTGIVHALHLERDHPRHASRGVPTHFLGTEQHVSSSTFKSYFIFTHTFLNNSVTSLPLLCCYYFCVGFFLYFCMPL